MTNHIKNLLVAIPSALCGMLFYMVAGNYFNWITPIWEGGEGALFPCLGVIAVPCSAIFVYALIKTIWNVENELNSLSHQQMAIAGFSHGILYFPCNAIVPLAPPVVLLTLTGVLSATIASGIVILIVKGRKKINGG